MIKKVSVYPTYALISPACTSEQLASAQRPRCLLAISFRGSDGSIPKDVWGTQRGHQWFGNVGNGLGYRIIMYEVDDGKAMVRQARCVVGVLELRNPGGSLAWKVPRWRDPIIWASGGVHASLIRISTGPSKLHQGRCLHGQQLPGQAVVDGDLSRRKKLKVVRWLAPG